MCTGEGCIGIKMFMTDYHLIIRISDNGAEWMKIPGKFTGKLDNPHGEKNGEMGKNWKNRKQSKGTGIRLYIRPKA